MSNGSFSGNPKTEWLAERGDDRDMRLLEAFWFIDPDGRRWDAPVGSITNGASIPRSLWSSVGSPYTGDYRRAAIVHDIAIRTPGVIRDEADTMFYYACLAGGCLLLEARLLYVGVRVGTWASVTRTAATDMLSMAPPCRLPGQQTPDELALRARYTLIATDVQRERGDFAAVRALVDRHLATAKN